MDAGPGRCADRPAVPRALHAARRVVPAAPDRVQPAGARAPRRGAGRGEDRRLAGHYLGEGTRLAAAAGAWICFEDEAGQNLRPPKARTWARRGHTPVVKVSGKGSGRVIGRRAGVPAARRAGPPVLPGPHPPRAQRRAPLDVRSRLRWPDRRRAQPAACPGHPDLGLCGTPHNPSSVPGRVMWPAAGGVSCRR